ncbi:MAG: DUF5990 family protein [Micropepsaceae bacterium]
MTKAGQVALTFRIRIERPVPGVMHSLQAKDSTPLDPRTSRDGEALSFDFPVRVAPGPRFYGDQVRPEGALRRFVYIRVGASAGDAASQWSRRMKIDIHDIDAGLIGRAVKGGGVIETVVDGTGRDGTPACATVKPVARRLAK